MATLDEHGGSVDESMVNTAAASIMAAIGAFGHGVLTKAEDSSADATVRLGQRLLSRLRKTAESRRQIDNVVVDLADSPDDEDFQGALRAQIKKAIRKDIELAHDLDRITMESGIVASISGARSIANQNNCGIISTGDNTSNRIWN